MSITPPDSSDAPLPIGIPADEPNPPTDEARQLIVAAWQSLHDRLEREGWPLLPLVDTLMRHPRLSLLYPFTSLDKLCLSRCTAYPFSADCPHAQAVGEGRFCVVGPRYRVVPYEEEDGSLWRLATYERRGEGNVQEAIAWMASGLPPGCGPAILGNEDDLRRHLGLPVQDAMTRQLFYNAIRDPQALMAQLAAGVSDVNVADYEGFTPLMFAVLGGHVEVVPLLLAQGADVHRRTEGDETALSLVQFGEDKHPEMVAWLQQAGATL